MTAIVSTESLLLAVLVLFVVALLRSHAEILRRLETSSPGMPSATRVGVGRTVAPDLGGRTPSGGARQIASSGNLLLAFLSSGCSSCQRLIDSVTEGIAQLPVRPAWSS